jgi:hypothetical protein
MATDTAPGGEYQPPSGGGVTTTATGGSYPLNFDVQYPDELNRWLPLVKWILVIPQSLIVYVLGAVVQVIILIALFAILFTRKYPQGLFDFAAGFYRWNANVVSYSFLMRDEYPPFSWDPGIYPVTYEVSNPGELNRWLPLVKWLLAIPHYIALLVLGFIAFFIWIIAFFAILFTTRYPRGMFDFIVGYQRWTNRVAAYIGLMRDEYPPFSLNP